MVYPGWCHDGYYMTGPTMTRQHQIPKTGPDSPALGLGLAQELRMDPDWSQNWSQDWSQDLVSDLRFLDSGFWNLYSLIEDDKATRSYDNLFTGLRIDWIGLGTLYGSTLAW